MFSKVLIICISLTLIVLTVEAVNEDNQKTKNSAKWEPSRKENPLIGSGEKGTQECFHKWGCHNGYCWSGCEATIFIGSEWCYTTRGNSQDNQYVKCSKKEDCQPAWNCAGSCTM